MPLQTKQIEFAGQQVEIRKMSLTHLEQFSIELEGFLKGFRLLAKKGLMRRLWLKIVPPKSILGEMGELGEYAEFVIYALRNYPRKVAKLLSVASGLSEDEIMAADFESACNLVYEVWELNNLVNVFSSSIKKVLSTLAQSMKDTRAE